MYGHLGKNIFIITSIVMFITALLRLLLIETSSMKSHLISGSKMSRNLIEGLRILIKNRYLVMLATAFLLGVSGIFSRFLSPFLRDIVGLSIAEISILYSMFNIVQLVSSIPLGHLIDVYTKRHSISLLLGASMLLNASIITMVAILAPLNRSFALLLILLPALNLLINIGLRVFTVSYFGALRSFAVAGVHATTSMGALIMPLISLIWILNPVLALVISGSVPNILAALILMRIASRIEIDKKENMTSS
jgi:predicted MFS family arabinose efflux permease